MTTATFATPALTEIWGQFSGQPLNEQATTMGGLYDTWCQAGGPPIGGNELLHAMLVRINGQLDPRAQVTVPPDFESVPHDMITGTISNAKMPQTALARMLSDREDRR